MAWGRKAERTNCQAIFSVLNIRLSDNIIKEIRKSYSSKTKQNTKKRPHIVVCLTTAWTLSSEAGVTLEVVKHPTNHTFS